MRLIVEPPGSASEILEGDEALLSEAQAAVRVQAFRERAVTVGIRPSKSDTLATRAQARGLTILRRKSGGEGLLHEVGDLAWSIVLPRVHPLARNFVHRYAVYGQGLVDLLSTRGIHASWVPASGDWPVYCLTSGRGQVLSSSGMAMGGASQHVTSQAVLHHGTLSLTLDLGGLEAVFGLNEDLARTHLTSLQALGCPTVPDLPNRLADHLARALQHHSAGLTP